MLQILIFGAAMLAVTIIAIFRYELADRALEQQTFTLQQWRKSATITTVGLIFWLAVILLVAEVLL